MNLRFEASRKRREREETVLVVQSAIAFYFNRKFQSKNSRMSKVLTAQQRRLIASMLRVNQAGELGAGRAAIRVNARRLLDFLGVLLRNLLENAEISLVF